MQKSFFIVMTAVALLLMGYPTDAMMGGSHGHMRDGESREEYDSDRRPERRDGKAPAVHRHNDYSHAHEGGELPHSHDEIGAEGKTSHGQAMPSQASEPPRKQVTPKPVRRNIGQTRNGAAPASTEPKVGSHQSTPEAQDASLPPSSESLPEVVQSGPLKATLQTKDETSMHLVPGGTLTSSAGASAGGKGPVEVERFYMDETQVTNHQYVEFLNKVLPKIVVENGVVRGDGDIWLLLGEVKEGYEPIIFEDGRFRVKGVHHAACAVLRVTAYGASAYARFFGKRLPFETEWLYAAMAGASRSSKNGEAIDVASGMASASGGQGQDIGQAIPAAGKSDFPPIPSPVMLYPANSMGIRGLDANIGEWGVRGLLETPPGENRPEPAEYVILGGAVDLSAREKGSPQTIRRYPWEAFAQVGFRCALDAPARPGEAESPEVRDEGSQGTGK